MPHVSGTVTSQRKHNHHVWRQIMEIYRPVHENALDNVNESTMQSSNNKKKSTDTASFTASIEFSPLICGLKCKLASISFEDNTGGFSIKSKTRRFLTESKLQKFQTFQFFGLDIACVFLIVYSQLRKNWIPELHHQFLSLICELHI